MRVEVRNFKAFPLTWVSHGFNRWLTNPLKSAINVTLGWGVPPIPNPTREAQYLDMYPVMRSIYLPDNYATFSRIFTDFGTATPP